MIPFQQPVLEKHKNKTNKYDKMAKIIHMGVLNSSTTCTEKPEDFYTSLPSRSGIDPVVATLQYWIFAVPLRQGRLVL